MLLAGGLVTCWLAWPRNPQMQRRRSFDRIAHAGAGCTSRAHRRSLPGPRTCRPCSHNMPDRDRSGHMLYPHSPWGDEGLILGLKSVDHVGEYRQCTLSSNRVE